MDNHGYTVDLLFELDILYFFGCSFGNDPESFTLPYIDLLFPMPRKAYLLGSGENMP